MVLLKFHKISKLKNITIYIFLQINIIILEIQNLYI